MSNSNAAESVGSQLSTALEHLSLAIEAATNLQTVDILLPVDVARDILKQARYNIAALALRREKIAQPPPTPPPALHPDVLASVYKDDCGCLVRKTTGHIVVRCSAHISPANA